MYSSAVETPVGIYEEIGGKIPVGNPGTRFGKISSVVDAPPVYAYVRHEGGRGIER